MANKNLHAAKEAKNDEFYTQMGDIQNELNHEGYLNEFKRKTIYCNCDDPEESNFWKYFKLRFKALELKELISTHYEKDITKSSYMLIYDGENVIKKELAGNGDFRSDECINILKKVDIVVTNPPFSLFREYIAQLMEYKKKFVIIGNKNAITYKEFFPLLKDNRVWIGYNSPNEFKKPDGTITKQISGLTRWFTNIDIEKRHENIELTARYYPEDYPEYDNYNAINVDKVSEIPFDYNGVMGVPITFLDKYNPEQFEIVALGIVGSCDFTCEKRMEILDKNGMPTGKYTINAKGTLYRKHLETDTKPAAFRDCETGELYQSIYARILIKKK